MKKIGYLFVLIGALLLVGCEMPFPDTGEGSEETVVQPTDVSDPNATSLPDGSGSIDPNVGGGAPDMPPATDEPTPTAVPPTTTSIPPTETAVSPTIAPTPTTEPTATAVPPTEEPQRTHTVAPGENLYRISLQYGLSWIEVAAANGITNPDSIVVGQLLIIPIK